MIAWPRRWPIWPTLLVGLAMGAMIALGFWQLSRREQKLAYIAAVEANLHKPAVAFPRMGPVDSDLLYRPSAMTCLSVTGWRQEAGRAADGSTGFRYIADCKTGAEGPGALVAVGVSGKPDLKPAWDGGTISGWIAEEPDHRSLIAHLTGPEIVARPMLVAMRSPDPALKSLAPPNVDDIPNNHLAYAVQWFAFAAIAGVIYVLALGKRQRG